ncbi:MAG: ATPase [marine bacterium B5-7]|nr:MAG: ATPase [marine bacterium B5-7]
MIERQILTSLRQWRADKQRKPLILRGARQVGKTSVVELFGQEFDQFISLNLEITEERVLFERELPIDKLVQSIFFHKNCTRDNKKTLLFLDEIQHSPEAVAILRYFYEKVPDLYVIAAGSLLETLIDKQVSFPVGRVEYMYLFPLSFLEYLKAVGEVQAAEMLQVNEVPPNYAHEKLLGLFHQYTMIGGMPEVVAHYAEHQDLTALQKIYNSLLVGYQDDVEKYAESAAQARIMRHIVRHVPLNAGERIKFEGFGQSNYRSREVGEAFRMLEKSMLLQLTYPTIRTEPPFESNQKKSPRLQFLDTGLMNHSVGLQKEFIQLKDLNNLYRGKLTEHIVGQQLLSTGLLKNNELMFWVRDKAQSSAEVDFVLPRGNMLLPIEVKSGATGALRSLHSFMERTAGKKAIRLYAGESSVETIQTANGHSYELQHLPYYLAGDWLLESA